MRYILLFYLLTTVGLLQAEDKEVLRYWNVTGMSSLEIKGTTNINSFICSSAYSKGEDIIVERYNSENKVWEIFGTVILAVDGFDCKNRMMNNDFQNTLKANQYPEIKIEFLSLKEIETIEEVKVAKGVVEITLAGASQQYPIVGKLISLNNEYSVLIGEQELKFSDFGLDAPQKGFGLIKVNDTLRVSFELMMDQVLLTDL